LGYQPNQEDIMHPTIANLIAADHQRELQATAERHRRTRRFARSHRARKASPEGTVRGHPHLGFQTWLAAGRL
jgi:hypothetical protein